MTTHTLFSQALMIVNKSSPINTGSWRDGYRTVESDSIVIALDLFSNPFIMCDRGCQFLNIETGQVELIPCQLHDWLETVSLDPHYYIGESLSLQWRRFNGEIPDGHRLIPCSLSIIDASLPIEKIRSAPAIEILNSFAGIQ